MDKQKMVQISTSKMRATECPHYFKNDYSNRDNRDATTAIFLLTGRLGHRIIDQYDRALITNNITADVELFKEVFEREWEEQKYIPDSEYEDILDYLTKFAEAHVLDSDHILGTEIKLALNWELKQVEYESLDAWLRMILDNVLYFPQERFAVITDYKTGRYMPSEGQQKKNMQTVVYPFGLFMMNPQIDRIQMIFHYIRYNWTQTFEFERSEVVGIEDKLKSFSERLMKRLNNPDEQWEPITGANCPICRIECPLVSKVFTPIQSKEAATDIAMQKEALTAKAKMLDIKLKDYTKVTGESVTTNSGIYAWHPSSTIRGLKAATIADLALERGISLNLCLSVDRKKIEKLQPADVRDILALGKKTMSTRYKLIKSVRDGEEEKEEDKQ